MKFHNGNRYTGGWKNGVADGTGTYTFSDGREVTGPWKNGCLRMKDKAAITVGALLSSCH